VQTRKAGLFTVSNIKKKNMVCPTTARRFGQESHNERTIQITGTPHLNKPLKEPQKTTGDPLIIMEFFIQREFQNSSKQAKVTKLASTAMTTSNDQLTSSNHFDRLRRSSRFLSCVGQLATECSPNDKKPHSGVGHGWSSKSRSQSAFHHVENR
jgi:hypothetical protein